MSIYFIVTQYLCNMCIEWGPVGRRVNLFAWCIFKTPGNFILTYSYRTWEVWPFRVINHFFHNRKKKKGDNRSWKSSALILACYSILYQREYLFDRGLSSAVVIQSSGGQRLFVRWTYRAEGHETRNMCYVIGLETLCSSVINHLLLLSFILIF